MTADYASSSSSTLASCKSTGSNPSVTQPSMSASSFRACSFLCCYETPESRSLPALLAPQLRQALLRLSRNKQAREFAQRALRALAGFAKALKFKYKDIEVGVDFEPEAGLADNGDLEHDLQALLETVGLAAQKAGTAFVLFIDELQYVQEEELAALIMALHRTAQRRLPVVLVGAGLPQLRGRMGQAKSYAERLFDFPEIGALPPPAAKIAIRTFKFTASA